MINIGNKISSLLMLKKAKVSDLAEFLNITNQGVYKLIKKASIDTNQLENIANFFGVPITYFFDGDFIFADTKTHTVIENLKIENLEEFLELQGFRGYGCVYIEYDLIKEDFRCVFRELKKPVTPKEYVSIKSEFEKHLDNDGNLL